MCLWAVHIQTGTRGIPISTHHPDYSWYPTGTPTSPTPAPTISQPTAAPTLTPTPPLDDTHSYCNAPVQSEEIVRQHLQLRIPLLRMQECSLSKSGVLRFMPGQGYVCTEVRPLTGNKMPSCAVHVPQAVVGHAPTDLWPL